MVSHALPDRSGIAQGADQALLRLSPTGIERFLLGAPVVLAVASFLMHLAVHARGAEALALLDVGDEVSLPTWFETLQFAIAAVVMFFCARTAGPMSKRCHVLSTVMLAMSIDEAASLHERIGSDLRELVGATGFLYYVWVVPALMLVAVLGVYLLPLIRSLPNGIGLRVILSGVIFVGGAAFLELLAGPEAEARGTRTLLSISLSAAEELLEMTGVSLFIGAILRHLVGQVFPVAITPMPARVPEPRRS